jgi:ERF superfamily
MEKSETIDQLAEAAVNALQVFGHPIKNKQNPHFKNTYADLLAVVEVSREVLLEHGLWVVQVPDGIGITTMIIHKSGQYLQFSSHMPSEPQKFGSAFTYMRRYSMQGMTQTVAEEDDDAELVRESNKAQAKEEVNW